MERSQLLMTLLGLSQIGRHKAEFLCDHNSLAIIEAGLCSLAGKGLLPASVTTAAIEQAVRDAAANISLCRKNGWQIINKLDATFPVRLRQIVDPPVLLYANGNLSGLSAFSSVAVIGTRTATPTAEEFAYRLGEELAKIGAIVVSGLALGCDTAAHRGCLERGGYTAAVLPSGLDAVYPPQNRELAEQIAAAGCLLSEYPPETRPARYRFVERDRLQSGLSDIVIVVESELHGGAMHTAAFARRQRRSLLVVSPKGLSGGRTSGNQKLLTEGAKCVSDVDEAIRIVLSLRDGKRQSIDTLF